MAPGFVNLRFMCHCLAKAIMRHLDFSKNHWFLQDLHQAQATQDLEFSYSLPSNLKLTLNPIRHDSDEESPFKQVVEEEKDIGDHFIEV
jgi:uncharacterized protein VirK/YbjX